MTVFGSSGRSRSLSSHMGRRVGDPGGRDDGGRVDAVGQLALVAEDEHRHVRGTSAGRSRWSASGCPGRRAAASTARPPTARPAWRTAGWGRRSSPGSAPTGTGRSRRATAPTPRAVTAVEPRHSSCARSGSDCDRNTPTSATSASSPGTRSTARPRQRHTTAKAIGQRHQHEDPGHDGRHVAAGPPQQPGRVAGGVGVEREQHQRRQHDRPDRGLPAPQRRRPRGPRA